MDLSTNKECYRDPTWKNKLIKQRVMFLIINFLRNNKSLNW